MTQFSIVVPTLNEAENIHPLLARIFALDLEPSSFEIIFVDDGSSDGTQDKVRAWKDCSNIRLIKRQEKPDLTASILAGAASANSEIIVVMDADLSHPPERLMAIVKPVLDGHYDITVGSRYVPGGSIENWPFYRRWLSRVGGWIARPLCDINDATSGFFAFRRELIASIADNARGYKILLELIMAGQGKLRALEVPICFSDRVNGTSKLSFSHQTTYLQRLVSLAGGTVTTNTASRFALVGLFGVLVDALIFQLLITQGAGLALAHILSFFVAATVNYSFNSKWSFRQHHDGHLNWPQFGRFLTVGAFALLLRGGILALLVYSWQMPTAFAIFPAILATAVINYLGSAFYVFPYQEKPPTLDIRWRVAAIGLVSFALLLRLVYLAQAQLIPDEAYYWNYAQNMELSFYDHPPMVAWLIWFGTAIVGNNEFGVRISAFLCNLVAIGYLYALACNLYDKSTAMRAVLLFAVLPLGFASSLLMTPDAPLLAAWIATLYYMERALLAGQRSAWLGMGIAFGLGMLSKYTLGLLGIAALVFVVVDPVARSWMKQKHPYLAAMLALLLFSPVIIWNINNDWISFAFQSTRLMGENEPFSTHYLIMHSMIMLTPLGFAAAMLVLFKGEKYRNAPYQNRQRLFVQIFTGIPLVIFFVLSTFDLPKFHWTAPIWLAILPSLAWMIGRPEIYAKLTQRLLAAWQATIIICLLSYAMILHYLVLGMPGIPYPIVTNHYFWRETVSEIEQIVEQVKQQSGEKPLVVGMSKWSVASALSFYQSSPDAMNIRSRNFFSDSGAMYDLWHPSSQVPTTRPIILVGMQRSQLEQDRWGNDFDQMLDQPSAIQSKQVMRYDGVLLRKVYYKVAQGYRGTGALENY